MVTDRRCTRGVVHGRGHGPMCEDCSTPSVSRRQLLRVPPAALAASLTAAVATPPAMAARDRSIEGICRASWGAKPATYPYTPQTVERLTLHHSGVVFRHNRNAPATFRAEQEDHQAKGWPDIAYHILVDRHGNVYRARPPWAVGNSNTTYNYVGHLLVMCVGNFEEQRIPDAQLNAAINVLAWACARFDVGPDTIAGHRDYVETLCPGEDFYRYIADGTIKRRVSRRIGDVRMDHLCGKAGRRRVRQIENGTD